MTIISTIILIYLATGIVFGLAFITKGCSALDEGARNSGIGFRLIIFPASTLLWPYLLKRWLGDKQ